MNMTAETLWQSILQTLSEALTEVTVYNYFGMSSIGLSLENSVLTVQLPEDKDGAQLSQLFGSFLKAALQKAGVPDDTRIVFVHPKAEAPKIPEQWIAEVPTSADQAPSGLLPQLTFDSFVEGPSNQFAVSVAKFVAQHPGNETNRTNPFFMYGPTGVGKTHLLHAIGNMAKATNPNLHILYTTSENMHNEFLRMFNPSMGDSDQLKQNFRNKYRTPDILMVDDIQYISGKNGIQEEFFNIFNELQSQKKQIVMTSDRQPNEIPELVDRLVSRFQMGICADVDLPSYETRLNILMLKLQAYPDVQLNTQVLEFIAQKVTSSVRALEGALSTTVNYARMFPGSASMVTVEVLEKSILKNYIQAEESIVRLTCVDIQKAVCAHYNIHMEDLLGKTRTAEIAQPRQMAIFLARKLTTSSSKEIGKSFNRNHATVLYSCQMIQDLFKKGDSNTCASIKAILQSLGKTISDLN